MKREPTYVGIDVAKDRVDIAVRPTGQSWSASYEVAPRPGVLAHRRVNFRSHDTAIGGQESKRGARPVRQWVSHSLPPRRLGYDSNLVTERVGKLTPSQVALPEALDVGGGVRQLPRTAVPGVWIDEGDAKAQLVPDVPHRSRKVGVIGHDDRLLVLPVESIDQETRGEVHVRPLLLRVPHQDVRWQPRHRLHERTALDAGPEHAVIGVEARQRRQGSQVDELTTWLIGIAGAGIKPGP